MDEHGVAEAGGHDEAVAERRQPAQRMISWGVEFSCTSPFNQMLTIQIKFRVICRTDTVFLRPDNAGVLSLICVSILV